MNIQSTSYYKYSSHSHTALVSIILSHTHTVTHLHQGNSGFSILPDDTSTCKLETLL